MIQAWSSRAEGNPKTHKKVNFAFNIKSKVPKLRCLTVPWVTTFNSNACLKRRADGQSGGNWNCRYGLQTFDVTDLFESFRCPRFCYHGCRIEIFDPVPKNILVSILSQYFPHASLHDRNSTPLPRIGTRNSIITVICFVQRRLTPA